MSEESSQSRRARRAAAAAAAATVDDGEAPARPARRPKRPINQRRRRLALALGSGAAVLFAIVVGVVALTRADNPNYQQQITMPSMAGVEPYLVNIWAKPHPPKVGTVTLDIQVTTNVGSSEPLNSVSLALTRPDGSSAGTVTGKPLPTGSGPSNAYTATVDFDRPGTWKLAVTTDAGPVRTSDFQIAVRQ